MSLFGAMNTAIGGLNAQEVSMSNISDNIANSQTVGYKTVNTSFESLVESLTHQINEGSVEATSQSQNTISGTLVSSQEATSVALNGNGFFAVSSASSSGANGTPTFNAQQYYTRRGDFTQDKNGYLVNGAGFYLEGYPVNATTGARSGTSVAPINVPTGQSTPQATSSTSLVANLPSSDAIQGTTGYLSPSPVTTTIYDAQGNAHTLSIQFDKTAANTWSAAVTTDGASTPVTKLSLQFSDGTATSKGEIGSTAVPAGTLTSVTDTGSTAAATISTASSGGAATVGATLSLNGINQTVNLNLGSYGTTTGLTQFSGSDVSVTSQTQDGFASGSLSSVSIDANGYVNATYSNNETVKVGQVAVAQFAAPDQLDNVSGGVLIPTSTSGSVILSVPAADGAGSISPSTLEQSNVSLSDELTKMISAQQAYTSNSRVITTANQMVQTINGLIQ